MTENKNNEIVDFDQLDVYLINGNLKLNPKSLESIHQKSFKCWHDVWGDYYTNEHPSNHRLNSDEFTRQDDILAVFYKGECFGITFFKEVHFNDITAPLDSYFELWPQHAMDALISRGKKISICSQFTIAQNYRGKTTDIQWKYVLFGFIMKRFLESEMDGMTGTMRVKRGMGRISYEAGAVPLLQKLVYKDHEDESVDLVGFFHKEVGDAYSANPYHSKFDSCWDRLNGARLSTRLKLVA
jgi:hypothetical protein